MSKIVLSYTQQAHGQTTRLVDWDRLSGAYDTQRYHLHHSFLILQLMTYDNRMDTDDRQSTHSTHITFTRIYI